MAVARDLSQAQLTFQVSGQPIDQFDVVRYRGSEGLCQLYRFEIDLVAAEGGVALDELVGQTAVLSINTDTGQRWFHGVLARLEMTGETAGQTHYRAELVPAVWLLNHRYHCRIFQNKTAQEIIAAVLTEGGIASDRVRFALERQYEPREYCVQYRETDYNFICRLMEQEGMWWCFEHSQDRHVLVIADSASAYSAIEGEARLTYQPPTGLLPAEDHVFRFRLAQSVRPGAVVLNDYNFENPALHLEASDDAGRDNTLEFCDFPGQFREQSQGTALAELRKEEFQSTRIHAAGQSNCKRLMPGRTFEMAEHPTASLNGNYLVTMVTHEGKQAVTRTTTGADGRASLLDARLHQSLLSARTNENPVIRDLAESLLQIASRLRAGDPTARRALTAWLYHAGQVARDLPSTAAVLGGSPVAWLSIPSLIEDVARSSLVDYDAPVYQNSFECVPATASFRPPRVTPWPVMRGTQTARVVGPEGEEIHTDRYGRVKVQFDWDRQGSEGGDAKLFGADSSCWIRVCQGMAGGAYGMMFLPRVGQEVVVDFLEGDPDKPIIIGRVYNADHMPPYELPKEKTKSVIKTHSSKGGGGCNEIRFEDLKDKEQILIQAQRQMDTKVKASHFHTVGGSYHLLVGGEKDGQLSGEYREKVFKAKHVHIKGELRTWIEQDEGRALNGNQAIEIMGTRSLLVHKDTVETYEQNRACEVAATLLCKGNQISIQAGTTLELKGPGGTITISGGGIHIQGTMVYINSGAGPAVAPPGAAGYCPAAPEDPGAADSAQPGRDVRYSGPSAPAVEVEPQPEVPGHEFPGSQPPQPRTSWIEIELVDDEDRPVAGERYEIRTPDGQTRTGSTDVRGQAREENMPAGQCEIRFPRLDADAWERI